MPQYTPPQKPNAQIHAQNAAIQKPNAQIHAQNAAIQKSNAHQSNAAQIQNTQALEIYHAELAAVFKTGVAKELSYRTPLENLLNALKPKFCTIIQETRAKENGAKPDFDIYKRVDKKDELSYNALVGFVECKDIDKDLDAESKQIQRYLEISPNIILTNYRRFILLSFGKVLYDLTLFDENLNQTLFTAPQSQDFFSLIKAFFDDTSTQIKSKAELVKVLSSQSFYLSLALKDAYDNKAQISSFHKFFDRTLNTFQAIEKMDFDELDFCDTLAQSIVYGLFVSFVENENLELEKIPTTSFIDLLPKYFKTLNEFIYFSLPTFDLPQNVVYVLDNVKKTLALLDKASMAKFLNLELENIAIYLYEDFLKEYDELRSTQKRKQGGVFYTPPAIVDMIVSALDELLQSKFDKKQGFLDKEVKVLDFATGTGSFLARVFEKIISKESQVFKNHAIKNKFLQDIYGFELSFVAYIVARLKLGQILKKEGFSDFSDADFQIYLNNTLDMSKDANHTMQMPLINLDNEWKKARDVKHYRNLLVILGNPPYNVKSKNKGAEILALLNAYKMGLNETNIQPLDDDYIKFIRFAQHKLTEQAHKQGLMGFITNNSFLDGRTHRKMRESLARAFDEIYILNLHGDERDDENAFDIRVGVCISLFVRYTERKNSHEKDENLSPPPLRRGVWGVGEKAQTNNETQISEKSHRPLAPYMKEFSRAMRKNPTEAENKLWQELRGKKLGFGFRRQFVIDSKYIADFVCLEKRLIIECDGGQHAKSPSLAEGLTEVGKIWAKFFKKKREFFSEFTNKIHSKSVIESLEMSKSSTKIHGF